MKFVIFQRCFAPLKNNKVSKRSMNMQGTGFWWILLAAALYGALHSVLADSGFKRMVARQIGKPAYRRYYRLFFVIVAAVSFVPLLALPVMLPDRVIYTISAPWVYLTLFIQGLALVGIAAGVMQAGAMAFLGIRQVFGPPAGEQGVETLMTGGLFRWVRHPLYTFTFLLIWLMPAMSWNLLALNLGLSAYMLVGTIFEERKLVEDFGEAYERYRKNTPRIIPRLWPRR
jgi:methanethiol S-methyltransferase